MENEKRKEDSNGIIYLNPEELRPRLKEFIDIIEGYGVMKILSSEGEENEEVHQEYLQQTVDHLKVQTILGKNYRLNLFEDDSLELTFLAKNIEYETIDNFYKMLDELKFKNRTNYKMQSMGSTLKSTIIISRDKEVEDVVKVLSLLNIK